MPRKVKEEKPWQLGIGYDYRFSTIAIQLHQGDGEGPRFIIPLSQFLEHCKIQPHEIQTAYKPKYQSTEGLDSIDPARIRMLEETDFKGKVVLDVGGYMGEMSKIALDHGASRAIVIDSEQWRHYGWPEKRIDGVEYVKADLTEWTEPSDIVIAYNCLYHTLHPMRMLQHLRSITKPDGQMLLCTLFRYNSGSWIYFYNERECNETDSTVYFGPSLEALERMLKRTGWNSEKYALAYDRVLYRCYPNPDFVEEHPEP